MDAERTNLGVSDVATGRIPPGQSVTRRFPVVGEREPPPETLDLSRFTLRVSGAVKRPLELRWDDVLALPQGELVADIHCVTGWSRLGTRFSGTPLSELLDRARPREGARFVRFVAHSPRDHDTSLPLPVAREDTWIVHGADGEPLQPAHGYPLRTVTPSRYFYKSLKWLREIELLERDRLGFWERESSYHNNGDPFRGDERFTTGSLDPRRLERLRAGLDLRPWKAPGRVVIAADLCGWNPRERDLRGMQLKACDLRDADLAGADLREANLSLCDLRGASLRGADLRGADLEGANLAGADLTGADLRGAALTAARLFEQAPGGALLSARVRGARFDGATGLLEDQERFLRERAGGG